jgi:acyl dehydratase
MIFKEGQIYKQTFTVTLEVYDSFQTCSQDRNPLHTDKTFAQSKGYPDRVMHGNILNAFISYFIGECLETKNVMIQSQSINFRNPVFLNDKLTFTSEIYGVHESVNTVEFKFTFANRQDGIVVANGKISISVIP